MAGFESSTVLEYRLPDDIEPVGQNGKTGRKSVASRIARLDITAMSQRGKAHSEKEWEVPKPRENGM